MKAFFQFLSMWNLTWRHHHYKCVESSARSESWLVTYIYTFNFRIIGSYIYWLNHMVLAQNILWIYPMIHLDTKVSDEYKGLVQIIVAACVYWNGESFLDLPKAALGEPWPILFWPHIGFSGHVFYLLE